MSKSVKIWVSLLLITLAGYTLYSMVYISNQLKVSFFFHVHKIFDVLKTLKE